MNDLKCNDSATDMIAQAFEEMKKIHGDDFSIDQVNLAELERMTGITRQRLRTLKEHDFKDVPHGLTGNSTGSSVMDGYTGIVDNLLQMGVTNSTVVMERLVEQGFPGSISTVKRYIFKHKYLVPAKRQLIAPQGSRGTRYHTTPGESFQMDWGFVKVITPEGEEFSVERLKCLPSLATIRAHKNLAFIGPAGTGKTHLAQAYGYECCQQGLSAYFIKMTELRDKFTAARRAGNEANIIKNLVRLSCLIIDEVGRCEFDKENTRLFFDLMDRRYCKDGNYNVIFTSNKMPSLWKSDFNEDDTLLCALDRIFDDALVFTIKGESYRGKRTERILLQIGKAKSESSEEPVLTKKNN